MTKKQKREGCILAKRRRERNARPRRKRAEPTNVCRFDQRELPEHKPRERIFRRIDDSFVMMDGWQVRHDPASQP